MCMTVMLRKIARYGVEDPRATAINAEAYPQAIVDAESVDFLDEWRKKYCEKQHRRNV